MELSFLVVFILWVWFAAFALAVRRLWGLWYFLGWIFGSLIGLVLDVNQSGWFGTFCGAYAVWLIATPAVRIFEWARRRRGEKNAAEDY